MKEMKEMKGMKGMKEMKEMKSSNFGPNSPKKITGEKRKSIN
jgi:hypothetical protein